MWVNSFSFEQIGPDLEDILYGFFYMIFFYEYIFGLHFVDYANIFCWGTLSGNANFCSENISRETCKRIKSTWT